MIKYHCAELEKTCRVNPWLDILLDGSLFSSQQCDSSTSCAAQLKMQGIQDTVSSGTLSTFFLCLMFVDTSNIVGFEAKWLHITLRCWRSSPLFILWLRLLLWLVNDSHKASEFSSLTYQDLPSFTGSIPCSQGAKSQPWSCSSATTVCTTRSGSAAPGRSVLCCGGWARGSWTWRCSAWGTSPGRPRVVEILGRSNHFLRGTGDKKHQKTIKTN